MIKKMMILLVLVFSLVLNGCATAHRNDKPFKSSVEVFFYIDAAVRSFFPEVPTSGKANVAEIHSATSECLLE